jgi:hypothetical protein
MTVKNRIGLSAAALSLLCLMPIAARADHKAIQGRTGLPAVRVGGDKVKIEYGVVQMNVSGHSMMTTQTYRLHYPGPPLETGRRQIKIAVREDYYRSTDNGAPKVTPGEAKGFTRFSVSMDGRRIPSTTEPWRLNTREDTATRWRTWTVNFSPGQIRRMRIVSRAPLGREANRQYVQFVSQDLSRWRGAPNYLEIRFSAPGRAEARLAALEPRPNNINPNAVQWVYRNARPHRDIYLQMPLGYGQMAYGR